ncbi:glycerol-3-phosphate 1-O-acyltransferase PlsY [Bacillus inaquosorum]|uniref:glycerol-3-phosphate 1-O-acyltransferase PlsY n=1 Tax=Bacillus inaquosorum TaxID=483913 RepID=UPI00227EB0E1|nr:glycerol-3-phosphate 1-O-acyltransferase PlsY [Bacillus inaquosorum]MCY8855547.1 glycerol-3-phosphate 1-O-acyltransferase PlsY [Bacillus inaquosorum]MCY9010803.1 glycerol-3-phosphate 1-O-acyltransferase PlsY [Bacillus inaquosorum]MCY9030756.1 glycerol-3-phosphate 1-O-acyltransferase PlsY [Bacillus inaquosorum]MCY9036533.1 glycerol-3-phosphate 1-O-acyltransferase PlsY [Bacillus inaquosorum]MCY9045864.1 glycerol-3-phosphate 1-O-acyltransferase PlsY [Bacillus inaquosorum]
MEWIWYLIAYGLGSISFGIIISKYLYQVDIRKYGSNNPGATNVSVVLGKKAGFYVLLGDLLKGSISLLIPIIFKADANLLYVGAFAVLGHCFPVWWKFRGGKAVATSAGVLVVYNPYLALLTALGAIIIIFITRYGYLGSISIGFILFSYSLVFDDSKMLFFLFILLLLFLHRSNFFNYLVGSEPKIEMGINTLLSNFSRKLKKIIL